MKVKIQDQLPARCKTLLFLIEEGKVPVSSIKKWSEHNEWANFEGKAGKTRMLLNVKTGSTIVLLGLGEKTSRKSVANACRSFVKSELEALGSNLAIYSKGVSTDILSAAANGLKKSSYKIGDLDGKAKAASKIGEEKSTLILLAGTKEQKAVCEEGILLAESQMTAMKIMDLPANYKTPSWLAKYAKASGKKHGFKVTVLSPKQLEKEGLHALISVNKGSEEPAHLIKLEYFPGKEKKKARLALVGKGITFDTGGVSLKGPNNMHYMKSDLGGAVAVLGAVEMAAKLKLDIPLVGIIPTSENCIDGKSTMPGNVIQSYSGKTIEVLDTDAEGRLILADAIPYTIKNYQPETIIDLATLTGSAVRALGYSAAALYSDNESLIQGLEKAGRIAEEKVWRMPLYDDYSKMIESDVADIRNLGSAPLAGASVAAKFLQFFTNDHPQWAHLDIAGVAFGDSPFTKMKAGTGYGVHLLTTYMKSLIK